MCGIAGFVQFEPVWNFSQLSQTAETLKHRGPDGFGFCSTVPGKEQILFSSQSEGIGPHVFAGMMHRRLAIIDLSPGGMQPMISGDGKVALVFNGELYNYRQIRAELAACGMPARTQTDSEVLLLAYRKWGKDMLKKLDGMWSFAILDLEKQVFFASADPAGIKPFYFSMKGQNICFASEIKALFDFDIPKKINRRTAARFLAFGLSDESEETLFAGVQRLRGGHYLELDLQNKDLKIQPWHTYTFSESFDFQPEKKEKERADAIREWMVGMMGLRLQADVPLGVCLSGGLDSSAIAGLVAFADRATGNKEPRKAFMASLFSGDARNEEPFARLAAQKNRFEFFTVCPGPDDFLLHLEDMIRSLDEPPPGLNAYSQYAVFRLVSEHGVRVSLDGQGADEIFGGYPAQTGAWFSEQLHHGIFPASFLSGLKPALLQKWKKLTGPEMYHQMMLRLKPENQIFTDQVRRMAGEIPSGESSLNRQLHRDFTESTLPFLLKAADRNSMRWSVESRMPFADFVPLAEGLFAMPGSAKMGAGFTKQLLRRAAEPFLPAPIAARKDKIGFAAPNREWLSALLDSGSFFFPSEFVEEKKFVRYAGDWKNNPKAVDFQVLWRALAFQKWLDIFKPD